ncbi:hypothetical protein HanHA89_Chr03g0124161 [Helianthus annuus]|nr:hypothetical protein HanHA89_Chr03g0124161 [Helianthus annuus]
MIHIRCSSISVILFPGIQAKVRVSSVFVSDNVFVTTMDRPGVFSCYCVIQMLLLCFIMYPRCSTKCLRENVARLLSFFNALLGACVSTKKFDKVDGCESGQCFIKYHGPGLVFLNVLFC